MMIFLILLLASIAIAASYNFLSNKSNENNKIIISGIAIEKKSGKGAAGVEISLGKIEVSKSDNSFVPFDGEKMVTLSDGKFKFEIGKRGLFWIMARKDGRKVLKPLNAAGGSIEDILLKM